jgi:hypothetical protein
VGGERNLRLQLNEAANRLDPDAVIKVKHLRIAIREVTAVIASDFDRKLSAMRRRIEELEAKPSIQYLGPYQAGKQYGPGDAVSCHGSLWIAMSATTERPAFDAPNGSWKLAAKAGRDARGKAA